MKIVYAGDRDISVWVLEYLLSRGIRPSALLLSSEKKASHAEEIIKLCSHLDKPMIFRGTEFRESGIKTLEEMKPDYIIGIHFPYIVPKEVLSIPKKGFLNLHPAYLPFNRGWNTPTWAIWEQTPYGATLHFMDESIDTGDIIHQKRIEVLPTDTAHSLYQRVKKLELDVFREAWPLVESGKFTRKKQEGQGTTHSSQDIEKIKEIETGKSMKAGDLIRLLRALTTSDINESAFFMEKGKKYRIKILAEEDNG